MSVTHRFKVGDILRHWDSSVIAIIERTYVVRNREAYDGRSRSNARDWWQWQDGLAFGSSSPENWHIITDTPEGEQVWAEYCAEQLIIAHA